MSANSANITARAGTDATDAKREAKLARDRKSSLAYYYAHKEELRPKRAAYQRRWRKANPERALELKRINCARHRDKLRARLKRYDELHPEVKKAGIKRYKAKAKLETLTHYGGGRAVCVQCGYSDLRALTIDHINGGGTKHRASIHGASLYTWLRKNEYPEGYQTLCMNCQLIKRVENGEHAKPDSN